MLLFSGSFEHVPTQVLPFNTDQICHLALLNVWSSSVGSHTIEEFSSCIWNRPRGLDSLHLHDPILVLFIDYSLFSRELELGSLKLVGWTSKISPGVRTLSIEMEQGKRAMIIESRSYTSYEAVLQNYRPLSHVR